MKLARHCENCDKDFTCQFECGIEGKLASEKACYCGECYKKLFHFTSAKKYAKKEICETRFGKDANSKIENVKIKVILI